MVLITMTLGILLLGYVLARGMDNTNPDRTEDQEREDAKMNRKKWRRRMIDWNF